MKFDNTDMPEETKSHTPLSSVSMSYGFQVGKHIFEIEANTEKEAMQKLVYEFWEFIDKNEKVELLGGREK